MSKKNRSQQSFTDSSASNEPETKTAKEEEQENSRRSFVKTGLAVGIGLCAIGAPVCAGVRAVLAPVFQEGISGKFYPIAAFETLTEKPQKFSIVDDVKDAWMTRPQQTIGTIFVRKKGDSVLAFQSLCPHAGCVVQFAARKNPATGQDEEMFHCPCHGAHFDLTGKRLGENSPSPRDLDALETKVENGMVFVQYAQFVFGIAEKKT